MAFRLPQLFRRGAGARRPALRADYAPASNGQPDPGEVCWAWVPYEEDPSQGKDRPILVIAVSGGQVIALPLTSKDHDRDAAQEARAGRFWMDVGSGDWDRQRRPSEVRLNRVLVLDVQSVRREGGALPRATFDAVIAAATPYLPQGPS
ncbi:type II toxin-antitoxin system PemK/MazF family toxin [Nocardioides marmoriginsengisoli]|uniref:Type II toxin-antitoxin system PemK/MazF family toxin n=1 Tax=Nocardioides marmoriginsengisoli TaxID=661483 RepID=A0A3N0CL59_9ACTN|nr:type II toxin-antitoxin system PemK/MazF family toxin [Nocardioides marmoriginsengisoli]RNL64195.1 type II toxin-antitoxin system PemK/MazF family toxin [Nocardioides marmoriginsengisoli]